MKAKKHLDLRIPLWWPDGPGWRRLTRALVPHPGTLFTTLLVVGAILLAQDAGALPLGAPRLSGDSTTTISYQGRLADSAGNPITTSGVGIQFCLYDTDVGGSPVDGWCENHPSVPVEDGLFSVLLGSINPIPVSTLANHGTLWLGIKVGSDSEMTPREQIASAPYAMVVSTVADGAITTAKIAAGSVTADKLSDSLFILKGGSVPVTVSGSRPFYNFGTTTISFDQPFSNKALFVNAHLNVNGTYIGVPIARPWTWDREGFTVSSFFYVDRDVTSASVGYTALGY